MTDYREGDLVRITSKDSGEGYQVRLRRCPDEKSDRYAARTLFAPSDPSAHWETWTFLSWYLGPGLEQYDIELIERAKTYTKDEVMKLARKAAYFADPDYDYGGMVKTTIKKLEESL